MRQAVRFVIVFIVAFYVAVNAGLGGEPRTEAGESDTYNAGYSFGDQYAVPIIVALVATALVMFVLELRRR